MQDIKCMVNSWEWVWKGQGHMRMLDVQVGMVNRWEVVGKGQGPRRMLEVQVGMVNSVLVIVTLEDILMYITIVYCCTPIEDVFLSIQDVIIVYGHWGKPSIVSRGNSPQDECNKGEVSLARLRGRPSYVLGQLVDVYK